MAAALDLAPDTTQVLHALAGLHAHLDHLQSLPLTHLEAPTVREVDRALRRLEAFKLRMLATADTTSVATDAGFTDTSAWAARQTTTSRASAAREVALATGLATGHDPTAQALDQGLVSPEHAAVILTATSQLPGGVSQQQREQVEEALVADAQRYDPDQLRRRARRVLETIEPDQAVVDAHEDEQVRTEEQAARDTCSLTLHDNDDGTTTGHFTVPTLAAAILRKVIESMTAPRRMREPGDSPTGTGRRAFDWRHRRGLAFAELLEHLPTDHLHPKSAATLVVTIDHSVLGDALKVAGLDTGQVISAGEARRLACSSGLIPAVLGGASVALDLGRESRLFSESQRIATGLHHDTCAAHGCHRPYAWCELHHRQPWSHSGKTDLRDAVPLCHWHHQRIHDHGFLHTYLPDGTIRFRRRP